MKLEAQLAELKHQQQALPLNEQAKLACDLAKKFEKASEYEGACEALAEFWPDRDRGPLLEGLDQLTTAEVLLRVGNLAGWLGSTGQTTGSQERAKDLITRSIETFEEFQLDEKIAEARGDLALCYWREGSFDEARVQLRAALHLVPEENTDLHAILLIRAGIIEERRQRLQEALRYYYQAEPLLDRSEDHALKGSFHNEFALLFTRLGTEENRRDYLDKALIEAAAASFHFEQVGNIRFLARVENNLGYLYFTLGQYSDAHKHLDRARYLFFETKDVGTAAQVDDTRARTFLAEGKVADAERVSRSAVRSLERGGEQAVLAEALNTHGIAQARLGHQTRARTLLDRAVGIAQTTGDFEGAGRAKLSIIEELGYKMSAKELISTFHSALDLSKDSQDPLTLRRLITCMEIVLRSFQSASDVEAFEALDWNWEGFSLKRETLKFQATYIQLALRDAEGSVTKAAHLLGFKHHQSLISLLGGRHKELLGARSKVRKRRRPLFSKTTRAQPRSKQTATPIASILHVDDDAAIIEVVADILSEEGMEVSSYMSGTAALKKLASRASYDLIIVDNDLPGMSGLELLRRARKMARWRATPIVMLSGDDCEKEAWRAGVSDFLRKPEDINQLTSRINRLLASAKDRSD
ncbi:MAG TPA: response regulator [Pyrinomonadaceae bacterium]|nr:response regulator [Pyrinomonadaceae bacterium]